MSLNIFFLNINFIVKKLPINMVLFKISVYYMPSIMQIVSSLLLKICYINLTNEALEV